MMELETERPPVAVTTEGQPNAVGANGEAPFAHRRADGKPDSIAIPRIAFERLVQWGIDLLDTADGDADREGECSEDEQSRCADDGQAMCDDGPGCDIADAGGMHDEDGQNTMFANRADSGAGCPIADPGGCEHDGREPDDGR